MRAIEIGRRMAELGQMPDALQAYGLALEKEAEQLQPAETLEAAVFLLERGGDYKTAYHAFLSLYQAGTYREEIFSILFGAFYEPNIPDLLRQYEENVKGLETYPWLFRRDFPAFEDLPLLFFPFDDNSFVPFNTETGEFLPLFSPRWEEITHYFFRDLEKPVLAENIFSQYELEYLNDNVRRSEDVGRENHIYLHYSSWEVFCAYLQAVSLKELLEAQKAVFLFGDEIAQYPIDFKERFGVDYSQYPLRSVRLGEVTRMIWHTQLSAHNGGDFFNELFDFHPSLLFRDSIFLTDIEEEILLVRESLRAARSLKDAQEFLFDHWKDPGLVEELYSMPDPSDRDLLVAFYLGESNRAGNRDMASRIAPALFFQPHFPNIIYKFEVNQRGETVLLSDEVDHIRQSSLFKSFKYIKTFTPVRRFTSSYGGSLRFYENVSPDLCKAEQRERMERAKRASVPPGSPNAAGVSQAAEGTMAKTAADSGQYSLTVIEDLLGERVRNRSFMVDPEDRLFRDSIFVRLEDGKLNPEATLTRLAAFVDLPYTETMTYCSSFGVRSSVSADEEGTDLYGVGFDLQSVYKSYDEYVGSNEKRYIEYLMRDAYQYFGYDFQVYDGSPVDDAVMSDWLSHLDTLDEFLHRVQMRLFDDYKELSGEDTFDSEEEREKMFTSLLNIIHEDEQQTALALMTELRFVNRNGVPLRMGRLLEPDPALMVKPLYR